MESIGFASGEVEVVDGLVTLRGGELQNLREFDDDVYDNSWGTGDPERGRVTASRITYGTSGLRVDRYEAPCTASPGLTVPALAEFKRVK